MWALVRARGRSQAAAALAGSRSRCGAFMVLELRHAMFVATTAWLPVGACGAWRGVRRSARSIRLLVRARRALALLAGGWSMLGWGALVVVVYAGPALARAGDRARGGSSPLAGGRSASRWRWCRSCRRWRTRGCRRARSALNPSASSYAWPSWRYLITLFVPTLLRRRRARDLLRRAHQWELCGYGIGVVGGAARARLAGLRERRGERLALFAPLSAAWLARGGRIASLRHVPLFSSLRCPARALYMWTLVRRSWPPTGSTPR